MEIQTTQNQKQTIGGVIAEKIAGHIRAHKFTDLLKQAVELIAGLFIGAVFAAPGHVLAAFEWMITTHGYVIPKVVGVMMLFFYRKSFVKIYSKAKRHFAKRASASEKEKLIDGIPVSELADYLIRNTNFKREGVNGVRETFGLNMEKFNRLAQNLERRKVLKRGESNMRILDGRWSRQALIDFLGQSEKSGEAESWFRVFKINDETAKVRLDKHEIAAAQ
jgi:hypothetical protein